MNESCCSYMCMYTSVLRMRSWWHTYGLLASGPEEVWQEVNCTVHICCKECADLHSNVVEKLKGLGSQLA